MKTKYIKPTTEAVLIEGGYYLLSGSPAGVTATMSGYDAETESGDGFSQE